MVSPLYVDVSAGIRAKLDDLIVSGGATFTDAYCLKYAQMAQDTLVEILVDNSVRRALARTETPLSVPAGTTLLDYQTSAGGSAGTGVAQVLPDDFRNADQLWEAKVGGQNEDFFPMSGPNPIPRIPQSDTLGYWDEYDGRIHLLGSTVARLVRMMYWSDLAAINPASHIKITVGGNALICIAASDIARSRGSNMLADSLATYNNDGTMGGEAGFHIARIINAYIKEQQSEPVRRKPAFGFDRYSTSNLWTRMPGR